MEIKNYITALENIDGLLWQVIGALKGELAKKTRVNVLMHNQKLNY